MALSMACVGPSVITSCSPGGLGFGGSGLGLWVGGVGVRIES